MEAAGDVGAWLRKIGLPGLVDTFERAKYDDLDVVKELKSEDLVELGITEAGVRKKLLVHASRLVDPSNAQWLPQAWHRDIKIMNDGLHGHMHMPTYCIDFIDTPQFQRLRDLKQLGTSYYGTHARIFPFLACTHVVLSSLSLSVCVCVCARAHRWMLLLLCCTLRSASATVVRL
jgi:hypothetical protein